MENKIILGLTAFDITAIFFGLMVSILFIQSGLDKVFNYQGEKAFYTQHFSKTFLAPIVPLLMLVITLIEIASGFLTAMGVVLFLLYGTTQLAVMGTALACISIIQLFMGQRIAKDYAGAAVLIPYFLLTTGAFLLFASS